MYIINKAVRYEEGEVVLLKLCRKKIEIFTHATVRVKKMFRQVQLHSFVTIILVGNTIRAWASTTDFIVNEELDLNLSNLKNKKHGLQAK